MKIDNFVHLNLRNTFNIVIFEIKTSIFHCKYNFNNSF